MQSRMAIQCAIRIHGLWSMVHEVPRRRVYQQRLDATATSKDVDMGIHAWRVTVYMHKRYTGLLRNPNPHLLVTHQRARRKKRAFIFFKEISAKH